MKARFTPFLALLFAFPLSLAIWMPAPGVCDDAGSISVKAEVDRAFFTIGDRVRFKITIEHPQSVQILRIDTSETFKDFEVKEEKDFKTESHGVTMRGREVVFTGYELGDYVLSPAVIYYLADSSGSEQKRVETNKLYVSLESIHKDGKVGSDIAGIKGVVGLSRKWLVWLIVLVFLMVTAAAFYLYHIRKKKMGLEADLVSLLAPHEEAYQALNRLFDSELLQRGQIKGYFAKMSEIIRRYIERRYGILALELTTGEILHEIRQRNLDGKAINILKAHLEICDLVKFAKFRPEPSEIIRQNKLAIEIIDLTKPAELPAENPPTGLSSTGSDGVRL